MLAVYKVHGNSMVPTLREGDYVVTRNVFKNCKPGNLVVAKHSVYGILIKRIFEVDNSGYLSLIGDNEEDSLSTESMGWFSPENIIASVMMRVPSPQTP